MQRDINLSLKTQIRRSPMKLLLVLLLLFPRVAMASDECCFLGPGDCYVISSTTEMEMCQKTPDTVTLNSPCEESPECMLSEEPTPRPTEFMSGLLKEDATFPDISGKAKGVR
jgi:hypothetical protein